MRVDESGTYQLAADFTTPDGEIAFSAPARGELAAGEGTLRLLAPFAALLAGGSDGPYTVTNVLLTTGTAERTRVAVADVLGTTGRYALDALPVSALELVASHLQAHIGPEGVPVGLTASARAAVPVAGAFRLSGSVVGPDGSTVAPVSVDVDLPVGVQEISLDLGDDALAAGPGRYSIVDLTLAPADRPSEAVTAPPATLVLDGVDVTVDITTLRRQWVAEHKAGTITSVGLYRSELNRLDRVARAELAGDTDTALEELDRFASHVEHHTPDAISAEAARRVLATVAVVRRDLVQ